jgi:hypothetical protein
VVLLQPYCCTELPLLLLSFTFRDILNHRYFDKRRLYLVGLYQCLLKHNGADGSNAVFSNASFAAFKGDLRKPVLVLRAPFEVTKAGAAGVTMRIIPAVRGCACLDGTCGVTVALDV